MEIKQMIQRWFEDGPNKTAQYDSNVVFKQSQQTPNKQNAINLLYTCSRMRACVYATAQAGHDTMAPCAPACMPVFSDARSRSTPK
eukprot:2318092-Pyramimonas_sp.AAC.1